LELVYHVRPDDTVIRSIEREQAHIEQLLHRSGVVFLARGDGRILLQHRSHEKQIFPDRYHCSCAFHVTFDETCDAAAERELEEETGVLAPIEFLGTFSHHDPPEREMVAVFTCMSNSPVKIDPNEATNAIFYSKDDIDRIVDSGSITPWLGRAWKLARGQDLLLMLGRPRNGSV
jgi:isopentenyl-diphosphate delta-isomerase